MALGKLRARPHIDAPFGQVDAFTFVSQPAFGVTVVTVLPFPDSRFRNLRPKHTTTRLAQLSSGRGTGSQCTKVDRHSLE
jgi:hypothetical protein